MITIHGVRPRPTPIRLYMESTCVIYTWPMTAAVLTPRPRKTDLFCWTYSFQDGTLLLDGKTPEELGVPQWRTQVTYVPQSRTQQKGTPSELYFQAQVRF